MTAILVVEDDGQHALLVRAAFSAAKLANPLHVVNDGDQAIAYLSGDGEYADRDCFPLPVLILLDLNLPTTPGLEVLDWLGAHPELRDIPAVILTASDEPSDIHHAFALGARSYLIKPVGFDALLDVVRGLDLFWMVTNRPPRRPTPVVPADQAAAGNGQVGS